MVNKNKVTTGIEIPLDPKKAIISKTDYKGIIQYANDYFIEISGYSETELIGKPHNIIRHPDMPRVVFKILWEKLHKGENIYAVIKNLTKNGDHYWVVTKFETTYDDQGQILSHIARRKAVPEKVKNIAESLYKTIVAIEKIDPDLAEESFYETLEKYQLTYDDFFLELAEMDENQVSDYFLSSEQNTNADNESILFDIDSGNIFDSNNNDHEIEEDNLNKDAILEKINLLKEQIDNLKNQVDKKSKIEKNSETIDENELKNLIHQLKTKNSLKS